MKITLVGDIPSQKNTKRAGYSGGKPYMYTEPRIRQWQNDVAIQLAGFKSFNKKPVAIDIEFYNSTRRRKDLDNACSGILDALVKAEIISDDSMQIVTELHLYFGGVDKDNPRAEITILENEPNEELFN